MGNLLSLTRPTLTPEGNHMLHFRYPKNTTNRSQPITQLVFFYAIVSVEMPVNVILPFNIEFNGATTTSYVSILGTDTSYYKSSTTRDSQCLLVEMLSSISSNFCMTTLFQTIPPSEILIVFCSQSLFYSVSRRKGLVQRHLELE